MYGLAKSLARRLTHGDGYEILMRSPRESDAVPGSLWPPKPLAAFPLTSLELSRTRPQGCAAWKRRAKGEEGYPGRETSALVEKVAIRLLTRLYGCGTLSRCPQKGAT